MLTRKQGGVVQGSEEYWYNEGNQRIAIIKRDSSGGKTGIVAFLDDTEAHYTGTGALTHIYSYVTMGGTPVARIKRTSNTTTEWEYVFHGLANNTLASVDRDTGQINASFIYAPFGEIVEATNVGGSSTGIDKQRRRMNDKYVDEVSGLAYYGFRYYDKTSMTWTQSDPLYRFVPDLATSGSPRRAALYTFSLSNPLRYLDPDGRDSTKCTVEGEGTKCEKTTSVVDDSEAAYDSELPTPVAAPEEETMSTGQRVALVAVVGMLCAKCGIVLGAGLFSGGDEGSSLMAAAPGGCAARARPAGGCSGATKATTTAVDPRTLRPTQALGEMDRGLIRRYAKEMKANGASSFPAIEVVEHQGIKYIGNGHTRAVAAVVAKEPTLQAVVRQVAEAPDQAPWSITYLADKIGRFASGK